jgi:hypothetical protein
MALNIDERKTYVKMLAERIAAENQAMEAMSMSLRNT